MLEHWYVLHISNVSGSTTTAVHNIFGNAAAVFAKKSGATATVIHINGIPTRRCHREYWFNFQ